MEGPAFFSYYKEKPWIWIRLPYTQCFCQNYHPRTYRMPYSSSWMDSIDFIKALTSQLKKYNSGPMLMEFMVLPCSLPSWSSWPDRMMEWSFKDFITASAGWQYLAGLVQNVVRALNQFLIYSAISPMPRFTGSRIKGVEMVAASLNTSPLAKFLLPTLASFYSAGLEVLVSEGYILPFGDTTMIPLN